MLRLRAPAKLNLYLRVLGRRADGYHEIETVFERINLADELTVESAPSGISLTCDEPTLSCGLDNLVVRAALLLHEFSGTAQGARIHLMKRIPIAAGLGGGSSDAAATLIGLNDLWDLGLSRNELLPLAARLGSDVPFFLLPAPFAVGRGRGDVCEAVPHTRRLCHVLVIPDAQLSTKEIYEQAQWDLTASKPSLTMVWHALSNGSLSELAAGLWNDLEPEAIRRCPASALIASHLRDLGCLGIRLSGSGPSVFGLCFDLKQAQQVATKLRGRIARSSRVEIVRTDSPSLVAAHKGV
jgi:4-diphosphocytidyl-2-C-methyl-D-erythritol kinase